MNRITNCYYTIQSRVTDRSCVRVEIWECVSPIPVCKAKAGQAFMSASAIAAARLQMARDRNVQQRREPLPIAADIRIRQALLAHDSGSHALSPSCTFEQLTPCSHEQPLSAAASELFSSHTAYHLPRPGSRDYDTVHRFCLAGYSLALNDGLKRFALGKERKARLSSDAKDECRNGNGTLPHPRDRSDAGVLISNEGGFQSYPDLFDFADLLELEPAKNVSLNEWGRAEFTDENVAGRRKCLELHRLTSAAVDELQSEASQAPQGRSTHVTHHSLHKANAWLNVNRAGDENLMHVHNSCRWSAVYYVTASPQSADKLDGQLLLRSGAKKRSDGQPASAGSYAFMAVPPVPGTLWLFPGSVPHRVLGMTLQAGIADKQGRLAAEERGQWAPRISIAINFIDAVASPTRMMIPR